MWCAKVLPPRLFFSNLLLCVFFLHILRFEITFEFCHVKSIYCHQCCLMATSRIRLWLLWHKVRVFQPFLRCDAISWPATTNCCQVCVIVSHSHINMVYSVGALSLKVALHVFLLLLLLSHLFLFQLSLFFCYLCSPCFLCFFFLSHTFFFSLIVPGYCFPLCLSALSVAPIFSFLFIVFLTSVNVQGNPCAMDCFKSATLFIIFDWIFTAFKCLLTGSHLFSNAM